MVSLQPGTSAPPIAATKDPLAGMTVLAAEGQEPRAKQAIEITKNALKRIRIAMAKEGISPAAGGLRVGITGGGCSGLSYNIRFDTEPRLKDRTFIFGAGLRHRMTLPAHSQCASSSIPRASFISPAWCSTLKRL